MATHKTCDGLKRRDFLRVGAAGAAGLTLSNYLRLAHAGKVNQESGALVGGKITSNLTSFIRTLVLQLILLVCVLPLVLALVVYLALKWWQRRHGLQGFDFDLTETQPKEEALTPNPEV